VLPPQCPFCAHTNPSGAKFCNECGAPLHLRPCNQCDAINNQVAKNCHKCGMAFAMPYTAPEAAPVLPALDTVAASASLDDLCVESGYASLTESVTESQDVRLRQPDDETAAAHDCAVEIVPRAPRSPGADMTSPVSTEDRTANAIPLHDLGTATGPHLLSRLALVVVLSAAVLTAVGVSAYYAYHHQTQPGGPVSAAPPNAAVPTDVTVPPANPSVARATGPDSDDRQMPTPSDGDTPTTPQRISISDQAAPSQQPATEAGEVAKAPSATAPAQQPAIQVAEVAKARSATAVAADPRHKTLRTGARRRTATQSTAANPSASTNQDAAAAAPPAQKKAKAKRKPVPKG
jgi:ribosomal protein L40E